MKLCNKVTLSVAICAIVIGYFIHQPITITVPDSFQMNILIDVWSTAEMVSQWTDSLGLEVSRWWPYPGNIGNIPLPFAHPDGINITSASFSGVDSALVIPKAFSERTKPGPALVFYHGGGWVFGSTSLYMPLLVQAAEETGFLAVAPDYRKSPQFPYPIPFEDCLNSTLDFMKRSSEFNVDSNKIVLIGDSAGGNLAMALTLELQRMKKKDISIRTAAMTSLIYPTLQMANLQLPSFQQNHGFMLGNHLLPKMWLSYVGLYDYLHIAELISQNGHIKHSDEMINAKLRLVNEEIVPEKYKSRGYNPTSGLLTKQQKETLSDKLFSRIQEAYLNPRISPLMVNDEELAEMPRTHIMVCEYDVLRDDGVILHERLKKLNKDVTFQHVTSFHGAFSVGATFQNGYYGEQNRIIFHTIKDYFS